MKDPLLEKFLDRGLKDHTIENYTFHLTLYTNSTGMTLTELIEEAEEEDKGIRLRKRKIDQHFQKFHKYLKEKNYSRNNIRGVISTVRSFYRFYDINLPKTSKNSFKPQIPDITTLPTIDEIKKSLSLSKPKYRAIILLMCTSGMGKAEILSLKIHNLVDALEEYLETRLNEPLDIDEVTQKVARIENTVILTWKIRRIKTGDYYNTFCTPESLQYILDYLSTLKPEYLTYTNSLFQGPHGKPLDPNAFNRYFTDLNSRGKFGIAGRVGRFTSHQLRRWFTTQLYKAGLNQLSIDFLLGHRLDRATASYFKADPEHLKREYIKVMENLAITEKVELRVVTDEEFLKLREELDDTKKELKKMRKLVHESLIDPERAGRSEKMARKRSRQGKIVPREWEMYDESKSQ